MLPVLSVLLLVLLLNTASFATFHEGTLQQYVLELCCLCAACFCFCFVVVVVGVVVLFLFVVGVVTTVVVEGIVVVAVSAHTGFAFATAIAKNRRLCSISSRLCSSALAFVIRLS